MFASQASAGQTPIYGPERRCKCLKLVCVTSVGGADANLRTREAVPVLEACLRHKRRRGRRQSLIGCVYHESSGGEGADARSGASQTTDASARVAGTGHQTNGGPQSRAWPPPPHTHSERGGGGGVPSRETADGGAEWRAAEPRFPCRRGNPQTAICGPHPSLIGVPVVASRRRARTGVRLRPCADPTRPEPCRDVLMASFRWRGGCRGACLQPAGTRPRAAGARQGGGEEHARAGG